MFIITCWTSCHVQQPLILKFICSDQLSKCWLLTWENSPWLSYCNKDFFHPQPLPFDVISRFLFSKFAWEFYLTIFDHNAFRFVMGSGCLSYSCWCSVYILPMVWEEHCIKVITDILILQLRHLNIVPCYYFIRLLHTNSLFINTCASGSVSSWQFIPIPRISF